MVNRPRWTTLNLAALSAATAAARVPRTADLVGRAAAHDGLLHALVLRFPLHGPAERRLLDRAVVLERVGGASWPEVAATLRTSARAAELRYGRAERAFLMEEAFPLRRTPSGGLRRPEFEVLDGPDAHLRTLDGLAPVWAPSPSALLEIDDATWLAGERTALLRMRTALDDRDLPPGADRLDARLAYESRRLACLSWELRTADAHGTPDVALVDEIAEATAECVMLVAVMAGDRDRRPVPADAPAAPGPRIAELASRAVQALEVVDDAERVAGTSLR
ncbi:hypothetical protein [Patulibacter minatonensis]|uniref:hypothetical protein n=1 Tax=Patulibacter minatonensis TaxID=298163 RepID=UPI0004794F8F|nr:hypothetical protein [Patulibacter minatonensis]